MNPTIPPTMLGRWRSAALGALGGLALVAAFGLQTLQAVASPPVSAAALSSVAGGASLPPQAPLQPTQAPVDVLNGGAAPAVITTQRPVTSGYSELSMQRVNIAQWAIPPRLHAYHLSVNGPYAAGNCTRYAWYKQQSLGSGLGNAKDWYGNARAKGFSTGSSPRANSTVVFGGGEQGAGSLGHVAHVEEVYNGGWFLLSEMNFSFNGGGYGTVSFRYAHTSGAVHFIYR